MDAPISLACPSCGGLLERVEEYALDVEGEDVTFHADRCTSCRNEYVNAPEVLRPDAELLAEFRPEAGPLGTYRKITALASRDPSFCTRPGLMVAPTLLAHLFREDLADVAFLAHQGISEEPVVAFRPDALLRASDIRMGSGRAVITGSGLRANLLTLAQLKRFASEDRGRHPRIAFMGRPCQVYTARKLRWDRYLPGYELAFALGTYCFGNFAPAAWGGRRLRELLGFDPAYIRRVESVGDAMRFVSIAGGVADVPRSEAAGLVNPNCLQCYDFSVSFSDVSVGAVGPEEPFESVVVRTEKGAQIVNGALRDGLLVSLSGIAGGTNPDDADRGSERLLRAMVEAKKQITRKVR